MIREVQREMGSSILFVTHDMAVHANMADRLGIMYAGPPGRGGADRARSSRSPLHPYTAHLIASLPRIGDVAPKKALGGAPPNLSDAAARLPLPSALPARHGHLPPRGPGADDARAGPPRRLLRREPAVKPAAHSEPAEAAA